MSRHAEVYKVGYINGYRLTFRKQEALPTLKNLKESECLVLLWVITEQCEKTLDHYEGYPSFYIKQNISVEIVNGEEYD